MKKEKRALKRSNIGREALQKLATHPKIVTMYEACLKLDSPYLGRAASAIRRDFVWLYYRKHENTEMHNLVLHNLLSVYDGIARYLDSEHFNELVPFELFADFPFAEASPCMAADNDLLAEAGMYPAEVRHLWETVDKAKARVLADCREGFHFQDFLIPTHLGYLGPREGNSWTEWVEGIAGVALAAVNVVGGTAATCGTLGLAAPIAAPLVGASVAGGVVLVGDAVSGGGLRP